MRVKVGWPVRKTQNAIRNAGQSGLVNTQYAIRNTQCRPKWAGQYAIRNTQYAIRKAGQSGLDVKIAVIRNTQYAIRNAGQKYAIRKMLKIRNKKYAAYGVPLTDGSNLPGLGAKVSLFGVPLFSPPRRYVAYRVGSNALGLDWLSSGAYPGRATQYCLLGGGALGSTSKARRRARIHMHEIRSHTD